MSKSRLESFSDGVIGVAITLLVLNLAVPRPGMPDLLARGLLRQWPRCTACVTSFVTIGIVWINYHAVVGRLDRADHAILFLNLLLLLCVCVVPFATTVMAAYLRDRSMPDGWPLRLARGWSARSGDPLAGPRGRV